MRPILTFAVAIAAASLASLAMGTGIPTATKPILVASSTNDTAVINQSTMSATPLVSPVVAAGATVKPSVPLAAETPIKTATSGVPSAQPSVPLAVETPVKAPTTEAPVKPSITPVVGIPPATKPFNYPPGSIHEGHAHHSTCEIFGWPECNHQSECLDRSKCCWKAGACETFDDNLCHPEVTSAITSSSHSQRFPQAAGRVAIFHAPTPARYLSDQEDDGCWCATSKDGTYGMRALVYPNPNKKCQLISGLVFHPKEQDHCWGTLACSPHARHDSLCKTHGMCRGWQWDEAHDQDKSSKSMIQTGDDKKGAPNGEVSGSAIAMTDADNKFIVRMMQPSRSPPLVAIGTFCYYSKEQEGTFKMCGRVWTQEERGHKEKDSYRQNGDLEKSEHEKLDWYHEVDVDPREQTHHKGPGSAGVHQYTHITEEETWERMHPDLENVYHEPAPVGHYGRSDVDYEQKEHYTEVRPHDRQHTKHEMADDYYYAEEEAEGDEERGYFEPTKHTEHEEGATWHKTVKNVFFGEKMSDEMDDKVGSHHGSQGNQKLVRAHDKKGFYHDDQQELWHGRGENENEDGNKRQLRQEEEEEGGHQGKESKFHLRKAF